MQGPRILEAGEAKTPLQRKAFIQFLRGLLSSLAGKGATRIGIGMAGAVSGAIFKRGRNLPALQNLDLRRLAPPGLELLAENDARCFARAEADLGQGRSGERLLILTIGTGIGRAWIQGGTVKRIKRFEYAVPWERLYQRQTRGDVPLLADFLAGKLVSLIRTLRPQKIVVGGGKLKLKGLLPGLRQAFKARGINIPIYRSHFQKNSAAIGAALLAGRE